MTTAGSRRTSLTSTLEALLALATVSTALAPVIYFRLVQTLGLGCVVAGVIAMTLPARQPVMAATR